MNTIKRFVNYLWHHKHFFILAYAAIYIPWFCYLERTVTKFFHPIHMALDDLIPFCEFFIIPYLMWFLYMAVVFFYIAFTDGKLCWKMGLFLITGMTVFLIVSTIYPNGHTLRPQTFARDNFCVDLVRRLYASDTATNLFPSIHVYNSLGAHLTLMNAPKLKNHKGVKMASLILCILIILSTMFLKQHSVFDVITAFVMADVMYLVAFGEKRHAKKPAYVSAHES